MNTLVRLICVTVLAALVGSTARAEPDPPERATPEQLAAHALARAALLDLRFSGAPAQRDYSVAEQMLAIASGLVPDDQTLERLYLEAANGAGDATAVRQITRRLVELDRQDTVAQLRAISARVSELQTVDERLAAYDRFLGAAEFDDSIRSRLALDAALLLRERGDLGGFRDRLSKACALDPTNKDAATLALAFYSQSVEGAADPEGRFELMLNALEADPFDPSVYAAIVGELLSDGAFHGANRFARLHQRLTSALLRPPSPADELAFDLAEWNTDGAEAVISRLTDRLRKAKERLSELRRQSQERGLPVDSFPRPEDVRLPASRERSRLLAAVALGDSRRASEFLSQLTESIRATTGELLNPTTRPKGISGDEAVATVRRSAIELAWLQLWSGLALDEAARGIRQLREAGSLDPETLARLEAWLALRTGAEQAEGRLTAIASKDALGELGLGILAERRRDNAAALARYESVMRRAPGELAGAFARTRRIALAGEQPLPSALGAQLDRKAAQVPEWLDEIVDNPRKVMTLEARPLRSEMLAVERTPVRLTIRNISRIPLAVGPDKPINSRVLLKPLVDPGQARLGLERLADIESMERRLRLLPGESLDIIAWPDLGPLSYVLEGVVVQQCRIGWRVLQGFELSDQRIYDAGPMCLATEVPSLQRKLPSRASAVYEALLQTVDPGDPKQQSGPREQPGARELADALLSLKLQMLQQLFQAHKGLITPDEADRLMDALSRRFPSLPKASKILVLCLTPSAGRELPYAQRLDQVAALETDEDVLAVAMVTRPGRKEDPIFNSSTVAKSPRLTELARIVKQRLDDGQATYPTGVMAEMAELYTPPPKADAPPAGKPASGQPDPVSADVPTPSPSRVVSPSIPPDPAPIPDVP